MSSLEMNNQQEFSPLEAAKRTFARWWIIVVFSVLGGIGGWIFHFLRQPVYEAQAVMVISMDFSQRELTQYEEDYAFGTAGALILSTAVRDQVVAKVQASGIQINFEQFVSESSIEGRQSVWEMRVRNADPNIATTLVNTWAEIAYQTMAQALEHAIKAEQLQVQVSGWQTCLPTYVTPTPKLNQPSPYSFVWNKDCEQYSFEEIENALAGLSAELATEESQSQGLISILKIALTETATVPEKPVIYDRGNLIFAGAVVGFVIALWIASLKRK
jgi:uncharacterized protein involved in exopolysaccharide biosynthesis